MSAKNRAGAHGATVFDRVGLPPLGELVPISLQHVLACFAGVITPAMIIAGTCGFTPEEQGAIIQAALIVTALDTFLQQFPLFGQFGSGLPIITGVSFAFLPAFQAMGMQFGFATLLGAQIVGGLASIAFGFLYKWVQRVFPPIVTGTVIFAIGVSLYPVAIRYMAGGQGSPIFGSVASWVVALATFAVVFFLANFTKGILKLGSILFGIVAGVLVAIPFGMVSASAVADASWFSLPPLLQHGIVFEPAACVTIAIVYVMVGVQLIGDLSAATVGSMDRLPTDKEIGGSLKAQGLVSIASAFVGGMPTSSFSQNVGIIDTTKAINRWIFALAAGLFLLAGVCPKLSALLLAIPQPVIGGATISVFGTITLNGIRILVRDGLSPRSCTVFGVSVAFGLGIAQVSGCLDGFPSWVSTIFATSAITPCAIMAIVLNTVLPLEDADEPAAKEMRGAVDDRLSGGGASLPSS